VTSLRPVLARLLALTIAVVAAGASLPSRAPQALRVWVDSAGEVSGAPRASGRTRAARSPAASRLAPASSCPALPDGHHPPPVDSGLARGTAESGTLVWPTASSGRDVVTRKRSLLI
jgi:hypothetical protein